MYIYIGLSTVGSVIVLNKWKLEGRKERRIVAKKRFITFIIRNTKQTKNTFCFLKFFLQI